MEHTKQYSKSTTREEKASQRSFGQKQEYQINISNNSIVSKSVKLSQAYHGTSSSSRICSTSRWGGHDDSITLYLKCMTFIIQKVCHCLIKVIWDVKF